MSKNWARELDAAKKATARNTGRIESGETYRAGKATSKEKPSGKTDGKRT